MVISGIHVFVNNRKLTLQTNRITGSELLKIAGFSEPKHWNLYRLQDENDQTGGIVVACEDVLQIRDGDWFRVAEGHQTCV